MMRLRRARVVLVALVALGACVDGPAPDASGRDIYIQVCSRCHGADLSGGVGPPLGPDSNAAVEDDDYLTRTITEGRGAMPSFAQTLSADQIVRVVAHLRQMQDGP